MIRWRFHWDVFLAAFRRRGVFVAPQELDVA
jgi:hypothetical protein